MPFFPKALRQASSVAVVGTALVATSSAMAGIPAVELDVQVSNGYSNVFNPSGTDQGGGTYNYAGNLIQPDFAINWDFNALPGRSPFGQLGSNFTVESFTTDTLEFTIAMTLPMEMMTNVTQYSGSSSWSLTGVDGAVGTHSGAPLWAAYIDGTDIDSLYPDQTDPYLEFAGSGADALSGDPVAGIAQALDNSIGITLSFTLSGLDTVATSGVLNVIPAPAALALFGVAGLAGGRRRRS